MTRTQRILVPQDGTGDSEHVLAIVEELARGAGATVRLLHVAPWPETVQAVDGRVMAYTDQRVAARLGGLAVERAVRFGEAGEQILEEAATWMADLVVIFDSHRAGLGARWRARLTEELRRKSDRPLLIYQAPTAAPAVASDPAGECAEHTAG